jgi:hypothetical protein
MDEGGFVIDYIAPEGTSLRETHRQLLVAEGHSDNATVWKWKASPDAPARAWHCPSLNPTPATFW